MSETDVRALIIDVTIERSTHPDFELFASTYLNGRQWATRGRNAEDVRGWLDDLLKAAYQARQHGMDIRFKIVNESGTVVKINAEYVDAVVIGESQGVAAE